MAVAKKDTSKTTKFKIANTIINIGETYETGHKFDGSANDGMKEIRATKYPLKGVGENRAVYFDEKRQAFDTGFYAESMCNDRILSTDNPDELIRLYNTKIKEPYEKRFKKDCSENNLEFWDNYRTELKVNKSYNTSDPKDLFDLFHALKQGYICNEGEVNPILQKARYTIKDVQAVRKIEDERIDNKYKAVKTFELLLDGDSDKLFTVLEYLKATNPRLTDKETLRRNYLRIMDDPKKGYDFVVSFLEACEKYNSEVGKEEMMYFAAAQKLHAKGKITKKGGSFYGDREFYLGNRIQDISLRVAQNAEHKETLDEMIEKYLHD